MPNANLLPPVHPTQHLEEDGVFHKILDMRQVNVYGEDLKAVIWTSVKATQTLVGVDLPDQIIFSHKQFISVEDNTQQMDATEDRIYITQANIMEVIIDQDYEHVDEDLLDILVGYDDADSMGTSKEEVKGIILHDK